MKYDEKTGEKKPECRVDEIKLSLEKLSDLQKKNSGLVSLEIENNVILKDISVSLALITDILGSLFNKLISPPAQDPVAQDKPKQ